MKPDPPPRPASWPEVGLMLAFAVALIIPALAVLLGIVDQFVIAHPFEILPMPSCL